MSFSECRSATADLGQMMEDGAGVYPTQVVRSASATTARCREAATVEFFELL